MAFIKGYQLGEDDVTPQLYRHHACEGRRVEGDKWHDRCQWHKKGQERKGDEPDAKAGQSKYKTGDRQYTSSNHPGEAHTRSFTYALAFALPPPRRA
jgi:hypothetical protein